MVQWTARTWPSSCSNHGTELFFTNDDGLYMLRHVDLVPERRRDLDAPGKTRDAAGRLASSSWYRGRQGAARAGPRPLPTGLPGLFDFNQWNANKPGTTLFVPVTNMTLEYINLLFIYFSRELRLLAG